MAGDIAQWLSGLGLGQYIAAFADNAIDADLLPELTDEDLKALGVAALGHRKRILNAVRDLAKGEPVAVRLPAPPLPEAERRQLTVLFCDLVGSTALSTRIDPEDMRDVIRAYQDAVASVVRLYDGYVAKFMGDGILAYFGYPRAFENDTERAIYVGLELIQAVGALATPDGAPLAARVGIATGPVVVGDIVGEGASQEAAITGETPNLAARLQEIAEPGTVVISASTHVLAGGLFETEDLGSHALKGFAKPVRARSVTRVRPTESRFEAARGERLTALIGRDDELDMLARRWQRAAVGDGQLVLITGEPGIGKSRLLHAFRQSIAGQAPLVRIFQCSPHHTNSALFPFIEQALRIIGIASEDTNDTRLDKLLAWIRDAGQDPMEVAALFGSALGIDTAGRFPTIEVSPRRQKELLLEAFADRIARLSGTHALLYAIEDAHWMDPTSLELVNLHIERCRGLTRALLVVTSRPEFQPPWIGQPQTTLIALNRLAHVDCVAMAESVVGRTAVAREVIESIAERTDGVPLFVEELTKAIIESEQAGGALSPQAAAIPSSLRDALEARLDRLDAVKEVAQIGAVIGREFDYELLARVAGIEQASLDDALARLVDSELVFRHGQPSYARYVFKHALVQDTAYGSLLRGRRNEIHSRVADALAAHFPDVAETAPDVLAYHFGRAERFDDAVAFTIKASEVAIARANYDEALAQLTAGLETITAMPEGEQRARLELALQVALSWAVRIGRGPAQRRNEAVLARAQALCEEVGDTVHLPQILFGLALMNIWRGDLAKALDQAERLMVLAEDADRGTKVMANSVLAQAYWHLGRNDEARRRYDRLDDIYDSRIDLRERYAFGVFHTRAHAAETRFAMGFPDQARSFAEATLDLARATEDDILVSLAVFHLFSIYTWRGDSARVGELAAEVAANRGDWPNPVVDAAADLFGAWAEGREARVSQAADRVEAALKKWRGLLFRVWTPAYSTMLAELRLFNGCPDEAMRIAEESLVLIADTGERQFESMVLASKGDALLALDPARSGDAEACYCDALDLARGQSAKSWELRAAIRLARLWRTQGQTSEARGLLAPVYGWFTEGFDTADLREAKALIDEWS